MSIICFIVGHRRSDRTQSIDELSLLVCKAFGSSLSPRASSTTVSSSSTFYHLAPPRVNTRVPVLLSMRFFLEIFFL